MNKILWASVHVPTEEQLKELAKFGEVSLLQSINLDLFNRLINTPSIDYDISVLAYDFQRWCFSNDYTIIVQPSGSLPFIFELGRITGINDRGITFMFADSERISVDEPQPDGTIKKTSIFKHRGFISM